jgi:2-polyprenyl-6-methoxyphenol hydroxylase-like FAD-dependent oxidoreductase
LAIRALPHYNADIGEKTMPDLDTQVLICGGGPVGLCLTLELALRGVSCAIVNKSGTVATHPQGNTMNARTMEHYRRFGISQKVRKTGLPADHITDSVYLTRLNGKEIVRFKMPSTDEKMAPDSPLLEVGPEPLHRVSQMLVEQILKDRADALPAADVRFGWRLLGFTQHADYVEAELEEAGSGKKETLRCAYLAGCDGAHSTVRRELGIRYAGDGGQDVNYMMGRMQSTYLEAPGIYDVLTNPPAFHTQVMNPEQRSAFITLDGKGKFLMFTKLDPGEEVSNHDAKKIALAQIGADVPVKIISSKPWMAGQALVTERYGEGRVFMAGDAVHLFTPTGGFGMNTGIDDAANLGWKLAAVCQGWGGEGLLASYESERQPIGVRNTSESHRMALLVSRMTISSHLEEESSEGESAREELKTYLIKELPELFAAEGIQLGARYDGSPLIDHAGETPPPDDPVGYTPSACPGGRAPHIWLSDSRALHDELGEGFILLRFNSETDTSDLEASAQVREVPMKVLDIDDTKGRALYEKNLILIRPDQHVAWRGNASPPDPDALIARVTGAA